MQHSTDPRIDEWITALPAWQKELCLQVRQLIHRAEPDIQETIKRTDRPYFVLQGNVCALQAAKDHLNIFIYDPIAPDPEHLINQGAGNATARSIQLRENDAINKPAFVQLIKAVAANNRAGGWRKIKVPDNL